MGQHYEVITRMIPLEFQKTCRDLKVFCDVMQVNASQERCEHRQCYAEVIGPTATSRRPWRGSECAPCIQDARAGNRGSFALLPLLSTGLCLAEMARGPVAKSA